ncbi:single-stranded DNA-binding protein [Streptomyces sp. F63]|uniref:single-stranded DNA-binding protein n=1 Tax=Streptomyces sp. F63 TaxID=2824887 RepID=UPI001B35BBD8|nr:single-stranded DNA-binding protein [Streptomyces sp. F63]MBQ0983459.1 single-stranded DNA-binding protein [Streptomyces sp. F63]
MNETVLTVTGNAATRVDCRETADGLMVARFRLAATARRWDRQREVWTDGPTSFYTVWTRRALAANVAASVSVGEPLIVRGRLRVRETEHEGRPRVSADIDATAVGHDLARGTSAFHRVTRPAAEVTARRPAAAPGPPGASPPEPRETPPGARPGTDPAAGGPPSAEASPRLAGTGF